MVSFVDSVLVGRTGTVPLAAVRLGVDSTNVILILGIGLSMVRVPPVSAAHGRRGRRDWGPLLSSSLWLLAFTRRDLAGGGPVWPPATHPRAPAPAVAYAARPRCPAREFAHGRVDSTRN